MAFKKLLRFTQRFSLSRLNPRQFWLTQILSSGILQTRKKATKLQSIFLESGRKGGGMKHANMKFFTLMRPLVTRVRFRKHSIECHVSTFHRNLLLRDRRGTTTRLLRRANSTRIIFQRKDKSGRRTRIKGSPWPKRFQRYLKSGTDSEKRTRFWKQRWTDTQSNSRSRSTS